MDKPVNKTDIFKNPIPAANSDFLAVAIKPLLDPGMVRIYVVLSITGVLSITRTKAGVTITELLNSGVALTAGAGYIFSIPWKAGETINLRCSTPSIAGTTCANLIGTCTGSPITLVMGNNTITVTGAGTFTVTLAAGLFGTATSGTATVVGSPQALVAGANVVDTGVTVGDFVINIYGGDITKLQIDEAWI